MKINDVTKCVKDSLTDSYFWPEMVEDGEDVIFTINDNDAFCRKLILKGVTGIPIEKYGYILRDCEIEQRNNLYCIRGVLEEPFDETSEEFSLCFTEAEESVEVYNCIKGNLFYENPWRYIQDIAELIVMKSELTGEYYNKQEKELLPLLKELCATQYNPKAYRNTLDLCDKKKESEWRDLYKKLQDSQKEYKDKVTEICEEKTLLEIRKEIEDILKQHGYEGQYPDFEKRGNIKGFHLEKSYDMTYLVGNEKNVLHRIHCMESLEEPEYLIIQFLAGTAFLKDDETEDIYGCLFNAKGKRLFYTVYAYIRLDEKDSRIITEELEDAIRIAVKKTELKRLTKKERIQYRGIANGSGIKEFLNVFLIGGGLYGIFMTIGMMLFTIVLSAICGQADEIPSMIMELPWWLVLAIGWIGFGGLMGILTVLADRK